MGVQTVPLQRPVLTGAAQPVGQRPRLNAGVMDSITKSKKKFSPGFTRNFIDPRTREANRLKATEANRQGVRALTRQQEIFLQEILKDPKRNAVKAAIAAGYTEGTAYSNACYYMKHPVIAEAIRDADARVYAQLEITHETVLREIATVAFASMADYIGPCKDDPTKFELKLENMTHQQALVIKDFTSETDKFGNVKTRISLYDKMGALQMLARHLGMEAGKKDPESLTINFLDAIIAGTVTLADRNQPKTITVGGVK
jgi:phage terminase small subunit